ncbi:hypothetical protein Tco_0897177 [Tanacetum coccineum]
MQAASDKQKSYPDLKRNLMHFQVGDKVMLKVSPWKGVVHFGKRGKLNPRYVGPFKVLEKGGSVAYKLEVPEELSRVHNTFHLQFIEEPVKIMDHEVKQLRRSRIPIFKSIPEGLVTQTVITHNATYQPDDLDAYDYDCDEISTAKEKEAKNIDKEIALEKKVKELDNIVYKMGQSAQTVHMLTKPQVFYDNNLKQALGFQNPFYLKKAQQIRPMLYDGTVIAKETNVISIADSEESQSKMLLKQSDPMVLEKKVNIKPVNYAVLNQLSEDFGKRFVPQTELSAEQAFWLKSSPSSEEPSTSSTPVKTNVPKELPKVRVSRSTKSSRSKSTDNTKNDRILQISSSTQKKNKVEDHSRIVKSCLNKPNCVVEPSGNANVQHSKLNTNSELMCVKCNSSMFDARHELCFLKFVSDMNACSKSKSVKKAKKKEEWKPTGKVFTKIRYNWRPTGRTFTLVGNACPLTRITSTNEVPFREPIPLEVVAQEPVVTKVYTRRPKVPKTIGSNSKPKIAKSMISNKTEPGTSRGSNTLVAPSSSSLVNLRTYNKINHDDLGNDGLEVADCAMRIMRHGDFLKNMEETYMRTGIETFAPTNQENRNRENTRRVVPVETTTSNALISFDGLGNYDWSDQAEEDPTNFALMAYSYTSSNSEVSTNSNFSSSCLENVKILIKQNEKLLKDLRTSKINAITYKTCLESVEARLLVYKKNESVYEEDIKFVNEPIVSEPTVKKPIVETSEAKASADKPKAVRKNNGVPIIED